MNVIFTIQHPAHVHLFRDSIETLSEAGHDVHTFARRKDINVELLEQYEIEHELLAKEPKGSWHLPFVQLKYELGIIRATRQLNADVLVSVGEPAIAHAGKLSSATSLIFTDTEHATLQNMLAFPFADQVLTPECYEDDLGQKQIRYPGYHELAYLHPDRFEPDPSVLDEANLDEDDRFVILRLVSWGAAHDIGDSGIDDIEDVVSKLEEAGVHVLITSEAPLPESVEHCQMVIEPHLIHHLMYYADLYIGESATMAAESAVLGTPAVFVSTIETGNTNELESRFKLVHNFSGSNRQQDSINKAVSILDDYDDSQWDRYRTELLDDKIDTTEFIISEIERAAQRV